MLGKDIQKIRLSRGYSVAELSVKSGVSPIIISGIENGTGNPTIKTLNAVLSAISSQLEVVSVVVSEKVDAIETLQELMDELKIGIGEIAKDLFCQPRTINLWLEKRNIPLSRRIQLQSIYKKKFV